MQDVCPDSDWYVPAGHGVHPMLPVVLLNVPGVQRGHVIDPEFDA